MATKRANIYIYDAFQAGNLNANIAGISIWGGANGQFLQTDGNGNLTWANSSPGGANTQVQFNDNGQFNGSSAFTFDRSSNTLSVANTILVNNITSSNNISGNTLSLSGQANLNANANIAGNLQVGNITTSNISAGNISASANISANAFTAFGSGDLNIVSSTGNINLTPTGIVSTNANISSNYFLGNGRFLTGIVTPSDLYSNANVANYLPIYTGNLASLQGNVTTTANISGNYILGNGSQLTGITASSVIGSYSNANVANYLPVYGGNILANNVTAGNNVNANTLVATGNGNLTILSEQNISLVTANGAANGAISAAGTFIAQIITSNTTIQAATAITAGGNITAAGGVIGNNFTVNGIANVLGNLNARTNLAVTSNLVVGLNASINGNANIFTDIRATGNIIAGSNIISNANISALGAVFSGAGAGNASANFFLGNGRFLTGLVSSDSLYSNANVANYLPIYSGNIGNGLGNIFGLHIGNVQGNTATFTANVTVGNIVATGNSNAVFFNGNGRFLTGLVSSDNLYSNANVANYLPVYTGNISAGNIAATSNVSSNAFVGVGSGNFLITSTSNIILTPAGVVATDANVLANYYLGNGRFLTGLITSDQLYSNANVANYLPVYTGNISAGTISAGNISVSSSLTAVANITASYYFGNGAYLTGVITSGNGSSFDIAGYLPTYSGNLQSVTGNVGTFGATLFRGNIQGTTANLSGNLLAAGGTFSGNVTALNFIGNVVANTISAASNVIIGGNLQAGNIATGQLSATSNITTSANIIVGSNAIINNNLTVGGNTILQGNLQVLGTETIINTEVLNVTDKTITIANGALNPSQANGGGFIVDGANASFLYYSIPNVFVSSHPIQAPAFEANTITANVFYGTFQGNISGNLTVPGSNTQVLYNQNGNAAASSAFTFDYASNIVTVVGNTSANYYLGNGRFLTGLVSSDNLYSNANVANYLPVYSGSIGAGDVTLNGNVIGNTATFSGNITTQTNVQANRFVANGLGDLNIVSSANIVISATQLQVSNDTVVNANVTANFFLGNGRFLTGLVTSDQLYSNANVANYLPIYTGNIGTGSGYIFGNGALLSGLPVQYTNANVQSYLPVYTGNLQSVTGNVGAGAVTFYGNVVGNTATFSGNVVSQANIQANVLVAGNSSNLILVSDSNIVLQSSTQLQVSSNTVVNANVTANYYLGNGRFLSGLATTDQIYGNANVAGYLPTYTGNLQAVTGNIASGAATFNGNVIGNVGGPSVNADFIYGTYITGNTATLTANITTQGNVSGNAVYTNNLLQANGVPWLLGAAYFSNSLNTSNSIATTAEINANIAGSPKNGDLFFDTSTRSTNHQPVYMYVNGQWRQFMTATNP